jgi:hypothetical protein
MSTDPHKNKLKIPRKPRKEKLVDKKKREWKERRI